MQHSDRHFVPAAGHPLGLPLYDPLTRLLGANGLRKVLLDQADLQAGQRVLDVGCGTGTLITAAKLRYPGAELIGIDPDESALRVAREKAQRAGIMSRFDHGFADALPYDDGGFDRVLSSFMLHHLPATQKERMLREVRRVLKPGGSLHLLDFAEHGGGLHGLAQRLLGRGGRANTNVLELMQRAGFADAGAVEQRRVLLLPVTYFRAVAPKP